MIFKKKFPVVMKSPVITGGDNGVECGARGQVRGTQLLGARGQVRGTQLLGARCHVHGTQLLNCYMSRRQNRLRLIFCRFPLKNLVAMKIIIKFASSN